MSPQSKAAIAAVVGALAGLGLFAGVVLALRGSAGGGGGEATTGVASGSTDAGAAGATSAATPPRPVIATVETGGFPNALVVSSRGVWVLRDGRRAVRVARSGTRILGRIDVGDELGSERPCGIAVGEGSVWAVTVSGKVARIDLATGSVAPLIDVGGATCVAAGLGAAWVTKAQDDRLVRIDPETGELTEIAVGGFPEGVAVGFGSVWVAAGDPPQGVNGAVSRIDPQTNEVVRTILVPNLPEFVAAGSGMVWASSNNGTVVEIDPRTNQAISTIRITDGGRTTVAAGGGYAWAAQIQTAGETSRVYRIDPRSGEATPLPASLPAIAPLGMAWGAGALWIADYGAGTVVKYAPPPRGGR